MINVKIIGDSICKDKRVTTFELEYPRYILAELNTHRVFSRNSASSRAIPMDRMIELIKSNPVIPIWTLNQKGMSGSFVTDALTREKATSYWLDALTNAIESVNKLASIGIHKQNANRLLEPFQHMKTVLTGTDFDNFFKLRIAPEAQPEICELASKMKKALEEHIPNSLKSDEVHCPYFDKPVKDTDAKSMLESVALCAQVSYRREDRSEETVKRIVNNLIGHERIHASPFEHIAKYSCLQSKGNLTGFAQLRHCIEYYKERYNIATYDKLISIANLWDISWNDVH